MKTKLWILILAVTLVFSVVALRCSAQEVVSKAGTPRFERYAWLSEKENDTQERWYRKNKKLYAYLFRRVKMEPSNDEWKLADKWREEDDTLFAKLYSTAWPENVEEKAVSL